MATVDGIAPVQLLEQVDKALRSLALPDDLEALVGVLRVIQNQLAETGLAHEMVSIDLPGVASTADYDGPASLTRHDYWRVIGSTVGAIVVQQPEADTPDPDGALLDRAVTASEWMEDGSMHPWVLYYSKHARKYEECAQGHTWEADVSYDHVLHTMAAWAMRADLRGELDTQRASLEATAAAASPIE